MGDIMGNMYTPGSIYTPRSTTTSDTPATIYAIAIVFSILAIAATVLRFYARSIKKVGLSWDDYAVVPALVFTIATAIIMVIGVAIGDLGRHTSNIIVQNPDNPEEVAPLPILTHRTVVFQQALYAVTLTQILTFGFTKLAVLLFYQRIFQGRWIQIAVWSMVVVDFVWTVGFFFSNLLQCYPISINWTGVGNVDGHCLNTNALFLAQMWSDVITNVMILVLPIPAIWNMQMSVRRKIAVCGIFLLGALTVAAGIAKLAIFYNIINIAFNDLSIDPTSPALDISYLQTPQVYWPMVESAAGIVGACLPLLRPLFAGATSRGFMRDLRSVDIPTSERSETLWDKSGNSGGATDGWGSQVSTVRWGSDSQPAAGGTEREEVAESAGVESEYAQGCAE